MSDVAISLETNDLVLSGGDLFLVKGTDAIAQDLQQTLQVWLGEWFLDTTQGIAYRQQILVKNPNLDLVHADLLNAALNVPGITQVTAVNFTYDAPSRSLSAVITAIDSNGETITAQTQASMPTNTTIEGTIF